MRKIHTWIIHTFEFSRTEANGFIVLMIVMAIVVSLPPLTQVYFEKKYDSYASDKRVLDSLILILESKSLKKDEKLKNVKDPVLFKFDPNFCEEKDLKMLGFNPLARKSLLAYRNKGGLFKFQTDLLKVYGMDQDFYDKISSFIDLPGKTTKIKFSQKPSGIIKKKFPKATPLLLDINIADTTDFEKLKGIGITLARRIIKYRNKLGGFLTVQQIKEVYGIDTLVFNNIKSNLTANENSEVSKLLINKVSFKELSSHPYMHKKTAGIILNYRSQHGDFKSKDDLLKIKIIKHQDIDKILPYLSFESNDIILEESSDQIHDQRQNDAKY